MVVALLLVRAAIATGQSAQPPSAVILFGYVPHAGQEALFQEGYRRHLEWHRAKQDSLVWYAWNVLIGERIGAFVDGTFGRPFLAFDRRVEPGADGADFDQTAQPFAEPIFRVAYTVRADLSTGTPLEDRRPTPYLAVITYHVRAGTEMQFEGAVRQARLIAMGNPGVPPLTWYRLVNGGPMPTYVLLVHLAALSDWDRGAWDLSGLLATLLDARSRESWAAALAASVTGVTSETWAYLPESSLLPGHGR
jgi:hypothetical protein